MLYLAIDQHKEQLTVNLRNEQGDVIFKGQIRTIHDDIDDFFGNLVKKSARHRGFMAIVEVCGFNDWLLEKLKQCHCREIVVIQPDFTSPEKTDRRDANALGELLWNNRKRLQGGQRPNGIRRIFPADPDNAQIRQLANFRQHLVSQRTRVINKIRALLAKHNLEQDSPVKQSRSKGFRTWLEKLSLPSSDRMEMNVLLDLWKTYDTNVVNVEAELVHRAESNADLFRLVDLPGITAMGAITLLSRIGDIKRFKTPGSLANYFGLTPGCRNSGKSTQRLGGITKAGSTMARNVLNFAVNHIIRRDRDMKTWYQKIKKRRGVKTARVAVMRRLTTIIWHMLRWGKPYQFRYELPKGEPKSDDLRSSKGGFRRHDDSNHTGKKGKTPLKCRCKTKA